VTEPADGRAEAYELAFEEAGRALDAQERAVNELRSRAGVLIAAAAITTSFFGSRAVSGDQLSTWVWVAVAAFAVVGICVLLVLWPRSDWSFSASAANIISEYIEPEPLELPLIHRDLALHRSAAYDDNARRLRGLFLVFRLGLILLVVEVASWVSALAERAYNVDMATQQTSMPPPKSPPQPIKPSPMQGETRGGRNGEAK
jgi:hypothetical protein